MDKLKYYVDDGQVDLEDLIGDLDLYLEVMDALGREATIVLDASLILAPPVDPPSMVGAVP